MAKRTSGYSRWRWRNWHEDGRCPQRQPDRGGGGQAARCARRRDGLVIDAGCRDVKSLREMGFPVWSKAISAKGTVKATLGAVNIPVVCAGINVEPGDAVIADDDGVVVVSKKYASEVATKGEKRQADEEGKRKQLAAGQLGLDMYNMRDPLTKAGPAYLDGPEKE